MGFMVAVTMKRRTDPECTAPLKKQKRIGELARHLSSTSDDEPLSSVSHAAKGILARVIRGHWHLVVESLVLGLSRMSSWA